MIQDGVAAVTTITLDKERTLRLDFNAIATFEQVTGKDFFSWIAEMEIRQRFSVFDLRALVYGCLRAAELAIGAASITLEQVGTLLGLANFESLSDSMTELVAKAMPEPDADPTADGPQTEPESAASPS